MSRTQTVVVSLALLAAYFVSAAVQAQTDLKIGFVNLSVIIQNAPQIPGINQRLRDEFAQRDASFTDLQEQYNEKAEQYERDAEVMGAAERQSLERSLTQMQRDIERQAATLQEDLQIRQQELLNELQVGIVQQVQAYAVAQGYDLVVTEAIYVSQAVDITAQVYEMISVAAGGLPNASLPAASAADEGATEDE